MKNKICEISLFSFILACVSTLPVDAAVHTKNSSRSYADAYNQVNAIRQQQEYLNATATNATTSSATSNLPVMVSDEKLASEILNNTSSTTIADLDACSMIYPNGVFRWEIPESGVRRNMTNQCVSVVTLIDANTNAVLATTTVGAGDTFKCNIDYFPQSGRNMAALNNVEVPADNAPTMDDVRAVMDEEQKQNAGIKIAAGAIIAGLAGNMLAPKEAGAKTGTIPLGAGKTQLIDTAIGAATGAGIMAASTYSGKVAGDTIKSTAVNAASGMLVGNMMAGASDTGRILDIQKCAIAKTDTLAAGEYDCIAGKVDEKSDESISNAAATENKKDVFYIINKEGILRKCDGTVPTSTGDPTKLNCTRVASSSFVDIKVKLNGTTVTEKPYQEMDDANRRNHAVRFVPYNTSDTQLADDSFKIYPNDGQYDDVAYFLVNSATKTTGSSQPAYIVFQNHVKQPFGGYKVSQISELKESPYIYVYRNSDYSAGSQITTDPKKLFFTPTPSRASDGGLIDMSNQARAKGTLVGTAAGGAMGGFAGYQGAQSEITDRWTAAVREYEDSRSNFVCMTGTRYLSKYNDYVQIPEMKKSE